jgi:7-cyano-7-deazaguanine synthase
MSRAIGAALDREVGVVAPYASLSKAEVMRRVPGLPLELTFSCLKPRGLRHCGACNKCAERGLGRRR